MYKAIEKIGGFQIGDEVPEDKAKLWMSMYKVSPVEKVGEDVETKDSDGTTDDTEGKDSENSDSMLDDYLARGKGVVKKNVEEDNLSEDQLKKLLEMEESDKKRGDVINAIKKRLEGLN